MAIWLNRYEIGLPVYTKSFKPKCVYYPYKPAKNKHCLFIEDFGLPIAE